MHDLAKFIITIGCVLVAIGLILFYGGKFLPLGRLPGDIYIQKKNFTFFFPITTSIIASVALSLIFYFLRRR